MECKGGACGGGIGDGSLRVPARITNIVPLPITVPLARGNHDARDAVAAEGQACGVGIHGVELRVVRSRAAERGRCAARRGGELRVGVLGAEDADFVVGIEADLLGRAVQRGAGLSTFIVSGGEGHLSGSVLSDRFVVVRATAECKHACHSHKDVFLHCLLSF